MENPFIGQMDKKIEIFLVEKTKSSAGGVSETETLIASPFAYMKEISGNEDPEGKIRHIVNRTYTIRYDNQVLVNNTKLKIKDRGLVYNVFHVKEIGRKKHLEIMVNQNG